MLALVTTLEVEQIKPNPRNPRKHFDETGLEELAASIKEVGVLQPLVVVPPPAAKSSRRRRNPPKRILRWIPG